MKYPQDKKRNVSHFPLTLEQRSEYVAQQPVLYHAVKGNRRSVRKITDSNKPVHISSVAMAHTAARDNSTDSGNRKMKSVTGSRLFNEAGRVIKVGGLSAVVAAALLMSGCGADVSDETAMPQVDEIALAQCEVEPYGIIGTPTDPVIIDGEEIRACLLNNNVGQIANSEALLGELNPLQVKSSWNYEPLVWVLDGVYEFGSSKEYSNLNELIADRNNYNLSSGEFGGLFAKEGTVVIVHRNARLNGEIYSLDDNNTGGGEWGGVIVNGIGYASDCPEDSNAGNFCNVKGPFGYYGGVGQNEDLSAYELALQSEGRKGIPGLYAAASGGAVIGEAGQQIDVALPGYDGGTINAAVTAYAPLEQQTGSLIAYSGGASLVIYGGSQADGVTAIVNPTVMVQSSAGKPVELNDYQGKFRARIKYDGTDSAVSIYGGNLSLADTTLLDQFNTAQTALEITGGATVAINNVMVQGFDACLQVQDALSQVSVSTVLFNCSHPTAAADSSTDYAAGVISSAADYIEGVDPELLPIWQASNEALSFSGIDELALLGAGNITSTLGEYIAAIQYPECLGVGTLSEDTLTLNGNSYQICDLNHSITSNATLYSRFSTEGAVYLNGSADYSARYTAWRLNGQVMVGSDFSLLSATEQETALASPVKFNLVSTTHLFATAGNDSELIIQPDVRLKAVGAENSVIEMRSMNSGNGEITSHWRGMTVNGHADAVNQLDIQYLRLFDTGEDGQAALTLNDVDAGSGVTYLDIYGAGADALNINGGAVNLDYLVMADIAGDQIAWSNGFTGTIETAVISPGDDSTGNVLHGINDSSDYDAVPRSRPVITNITAAGFNSDNTAILLEQGSGLLLFNSVFTEFATCLDIDDAETAALLSTDPAAILFDGVLLDCDNTLASDSEDSGYDYGYDIVSGSGVYEEEAVLDTSYLITGDTAAAQAELNSYSDLIGDAYNYLNGVNYIGAVAGSEDIWYTGWSDSVVIAPDTECEGLGILADLEAYTSDPASGNTSFSYNGESYNPAVKYCRILGGTYISDITVARYSGAALEAYEERINAGDTDAEARQNALTRGWAINRATGEVVYINEPVMSLAPTYWTVKGIVHIGDGNQEITDTNMATEMKTNPATLTIEAGASLTAENESSVLHITRGGFLSLIGEPEYLVSTPEDSKGMQSLNVKLVIDGFARHNQCPDAATAEAGSQVCNIAGEYGYYGGYDNDYINFDVKYLKLYKSLRLNAAGSGLIDQLVLASSYTTISDSDIGTDYITIDGGVPVLKNIFYTGTFNYWGSLIHWNHGYQGTIQFVSLLDHFRLTGDERLFMPEDPSRLHPALRGENVTDEERQAAGSEIALPRSAPTVSNMTLMFREFSVYAETSSAVDLRNDSGLYLYNSVFGTRRIYASNDVDLCFYIDDTIKDQLDDTLVINNLAYSCTDFSNNPDNGVYLEDNIGISSTSNADRYDYVLASQGPGNFDGGVVDGVNLLNSLAATFTLYPAQAIMLGSDLLWGTSDDIWSPDYSTSATVNEALIEHNTYMGAFDYSLVLDAGKVISD
ncbi:MAG: hypothetical protein KYX62_13440 [Pseudomonadota bacterium]|nr:hypothetical protein [Pseudomonadota bacterium]